MSQTLLDPTQLVLNPTWPGFHSFAAGQAILLVQNVNIVIPANYGMTSPGPYEIGTTQSLEIGAGAVFAIE